MSRVRKSACIRYNPAAQGLIDQDVVGCLHVRCGILISDVTQGILQHLSVSVSLEKYDSK